MEPTKLKTIVTVVVLILGSFVTAILVSNVNLASAYQSTGIAIDFGDRNVTWTDLDLEVYGDSIDALERACVINGFPLSVDEENKVKEVNGISNNEERSWGLWVIKKGELEWIFVSDSNLDISDYSVASWAYCSEDEVPTVGVDQFGRSVYGYPQAQKVVTLSPSITEILGSLNAISTLVGTDMYSVYPESVVAGKDRGDIVMVGDFLSPSFELIMKTDPDVVFCDGSQYAHYELAERIRKTTSNSVILYQGEGIDTILDNIYIVGVVMGYEMRALDVIEFLEQAELEIKKLISSGNTNPKSVLFALSPEKSPWVSGSDTYIHDIIHSILGINVFSSKEHGWFRSNSEWIVDADPDVAIIITSDYLANESEYKIMLSKLSSEWKSTKAYMDGNIFLLSEDLAALAQLAGPRYAQLMEIITLILHQDDLPVDLKVPKYIGNEYRDYLKITKDLGFE